MTVDRFSPRPADGGRPPGTLLATLARFVADDAGQDIVEYALLSAAVGLAGVAIFDALADSMGAAYLSWDSTAQSDPLVEMPDPVTP